MYAESNTLQITHISP